MRTKYFKEASLSDEGKSNLRALATLSPECAEKIMNWFANQKTYPRFDVSERLTLAEITGESGDTLTPSLSILRLFINRLVEHSDDVSAFYQDIKDLAIIDDAIGYQTFDVVFSRLPAVVKSFRFLIRRHAAEMDGAPNLTGSSMSAAMKLVLPKKFRYNEDKIEDYTPQPLGYTVVAQIELQLSGRDQVFAFHMNSDNFDRFITDLLALQCEMRMLETKCSELNHTKSED